MRKQYFLVPALFVLLYSCKQNQETHDYPIQPVSFKSVNLTDDFWHPRIVTNRDVTIPYGFEMCKKTGRIENFEIAGGARKGQYCSKYPFDDSDVYKIIEGASYTLEKDYNKDLDAYLDSLIAKISGAQEPDGYLETWRTIDPDKPLAEWWGSAPRWSNLQSGHELYNLGHLYEAAVAHYEATGKKNLLNIALKSADLICDVFGPGKKAGAPGHEEVEIGLMKLFRVTRQHKYLDLAKYFINVRGDSTRREIWGEYQQDHMPVRDQREAVGHAVRAGYLYSAVADLTALTGDTTFMPALHAIWNDIVKHKLYITGGAGAKSEGEAFGKPYELPNASAYAETCAAISMVLWNHRMFLLTGDSKYYDFLERTLYNGLISGVGLNGNTFYYENPLASSGDSTFNEGSTTRQPWFTCACCPSNLARFIPQIPGLIYAVKGRTLYVNLYISNQADLSINPTRVHLVMDSGFPWRGNTEIKLGLPEKSSFTLALRIPSWVDGKVLPGDLYHFIHYRQAPFRVRVNNEEVSYVVEKGYILLTREWQRDDAVNIDFTIKPEIIGANEKVISDNGKVAIELGPVLYCAEGPDNNGSVGNIYVDQDANIRTDITDTFGIPVTGLSIINRDQSKVKLIPYAFWSNRGSAPMKVWIDYTYL